MSLPPLLACIALAFFVLQIALVWAPGQTQSDGKPRGEWQLRGERWNKIHYPARQLIEGNSSMDDINNTMENVHVLLGERYKAGGGKYCVRIHPDGGGDPGVTQNINTIKNQKYRITFKVMCVPWPVRLLGGTTRRN